MSSISRHIKRAKCKRNGIDWPERTQPTKVREDHYLVLNPTKGWKRVSVKRLAAQQRMAEMLGG